MSIGYGSSVIWIPPKTFICPSGKLRTEITSLLAKYTSPGLSDTTFFHGVEKYLFKRKEVKFSDTKKLNTLLKGKHFSNSFKLNMWKDKHMQWFITEAYSGWKTNSKQLFSQCLTYQKPTNTTSQLLLISTCGNKSVYIRGGSRMFFRRGCTRLLLYFNANKPQSFFFFLLL